MTCRECDVSGTAAPPLLAEAGAFGAPSKPAQPEPWRKARIQKGFRRARADQVARGGGGQTPALWCGPIYCTRPRPEPLGSFSLTHPTIAEIVLLPVASSCRKAGSARSAQPHPARPAARGSKRLLGRNNSQAHTPPACPAHPKPTHKKSFLLEKIVLDTIRYPR